MAKNDALEEVEKNYKVMTVFLKKDLYERLVKYQAEHGGKSKASPSKFINKAVEYCLSKENDLSEFGTLTSSKIEKSNELLQEVLKRLILNNNILMSNEIKNLSSEEAEKKQTEYFEKTNKIAEEFLSRFEKNYSFDEF